MSKNINHSADIEKWLKLIFSNGVGAKTFFKLVQYFGSLDKILGASVSQLTKVRGIGTKTAEQMLSSLDKFDISRELELADKHSVSIITFNDNRYPVLLKKIPDPPPILYLKGTMCRSDNLAIAIVGSRRCSLYGQEQASRFAHILGSSGFTVISGMAKGIDSAAHRGALSAGARTIAVQGCGLCNIFPPENKDLFKNICQQGACISEFALQYEPLAENFPSRNRIIAGLSIATVVIEAGIKSGSLITASLAIDYNREVMAVPGKIDSPLNTGSHRLIKQGAKLIDSVEDIMEALGYIGQGLKDHANSMEASSKAKVEGGRKPDLSKLKLSDYEKLVYKHLTADGSFIEDIIADTNLETGQINASLISLRLKGLIKQLPGNIFAKN